MKQTNIASILKRIVALNAPRREDCLDLQPHPEEMASLCQQIRDLAPEFSLTDEEILVIATIHSGSFQNIRKNSEVEAILTELKDKGIIEVQKDCLIVEMESDNTESTSPFLKKVFFNHLKNQEPDFPPFCSLREYYMAWFSYTKRLYTYRKNQQNEHPVHAVDTDTHRSIDIKPTATESQFQQEYEILIQRTKSSHIDFPLEFLVKKLDLDENERIILIYLGFVTK